MACGCGGSGAWQADGYVPAANIQDEAYFSTRTVSSEEAEANAAAWPNRVPSWSPQTAKSTPAEA